MRSNNRSSRGSAHWVYSAMKFGQNFLNGKKSLFLGFAWLMLVAISMTVYKGSMYVFASFSVAFLAMLVVAFYKEFNYGYFYLALLLFFGFWVKLVHHLIFPAPYIEAVGVFSWTPGAWDEVLWVATVAAAGLVAARLTWFAMTVFFRNCKELEQVELIVPVWYGRGRKYLWVGVLVFIVIFAIINVELGIHQIGLAPRTILIFPLNALIAWMLNFGLATIIGVFLWWDVHIHKQSLHTLYVVLIEALFSSVSMLSRGAFIFHVIPQMTAYYRNRFHFRPLSLWQILSMVLVAVIFFAICFSMVDTLRGYYYRSNTEDFRAVSRQSVEQLKVKRHEKEQLEALLKKHNKEESGRNLAMLAELDRRERELSALEAEASVVQLELQFAANSMSKRILMMATEFWVQLPSVLSRALSMATNRWIGLEGVMALQSYPHKSIALLREGLTERYMDGIVPMYQHISKSIYTGMDPSQWKFGSLPGAPAFLYYSGSLLIVFLGMTMLTIVLHSFEFIIRRFTKNPFLASLYGFAMANMVAQLGVVPRQIIPVVVTLICGIAFISFIQSGLGRLVLDRVAKRVSQKYKD